MADVTYTYARKTKIIRAHLDMTQSKFARLIGVTLPTVRNWEQKARADPNGSARALIDVFFADPTAAKNLLERGRVKAKQIGL